MPPDFEFPNPGIDFWTPLILGPLAPPNPNVRRVEVVPVIARLREGVTLEAAQDEGTAIVQELYRRDSGADPESERGRIELQSLLDQNVGSVRTALWVLMAGVGVVLANRLCQRRQLDAGKGSRPESGDCSAGSPGSWEGASTSPKPN